MQIAPKKKKKNFTQKLRIQELWFAKKGKEENEKKNLSLIMHEKYYWDVENLSPTYWSINIRFIKVYTNGTNPHSHPGSS